MMLGSPMTKRSVLFVCAGNTCRSPIAEAVARQLLGPDVRVESSGTSAADGASAAKDAVRVMKERGLDISSHRSRSLGNLNLLEFDLLVALCPEIAQALLDQGADASKLATLNISDPYNRDLEVYRATAVAIEAELRRLFHLNDE